MSAAPTSGALDLAQAARRVPLVKSSVAEFAARHAPEELSAALAVALANAGAHAATVLAVAATERGVRLDPAVVRRLLPELDSITLFGPLALAVDGDAVALFIGFLDDGAGAWEREALAIALASELATPAPTRLLTHARKLARKHLGLEAGLVLGAAASRLRDPHVDTLAAPLIALAGKETTLVDNMLRAARVSPLDTLPTAAPPRISSGYTVRSERAAGRNDPCPCGSGKKYKKCCADKRGDDLPAPAPIDPRLLSTEQVGALRASELADLDPNLLTQRGRIEAFRRLLTFRRWDAAERFLDAMQADIDDWRDELVQEAIQQRAHDVVQRHLVQLPPEYVDLRTRILLDCIEKPPDLIDRLNAHARAALEEETEGEEHDASLSLAFAMLDYFPALGVFVARGALSNARLLDSHTLLQVMEEARDELGIAPYEPWWDIWDQIGEGTDRSRQSEWERTELEKITNDLRRARAQADETATEAAYLQRRLRELEGAKPKSELPPASAAEKTPSGPNPDIETEKKELRTKVAELQRIITEGQEERRNLRRSLASVKQPSPTPSSDVAEVADADLDEDGESVHRPRRLLIPAYEARAAKAMSDLPAEAAESCLLLVAELAAGREHAWRGVKRLRTRDVLSARAGIHYRVLFRVGDRSLIVLQVTHRRDLEPAIASLSRG